MTQTASQNTDTIAPGAAGQGKGALGPLQAQTLAFLTGCGRSGTTILGTLLGSRPDVAYFNDRFDLWVRPMPVTDIWGYFRAAKPTPARVALGEQDAPGPDARRRFFELLEHERAGRPVVIEKLAINNFRLPFLRALVPGCPIINILRNGIEVAYSIQDKILKNEWYGLKDRKWNLLVEHAYIAGCGHLLKYCNGPLQRGLLEWRMSVEAADRWMEVPGQTGFVQVRYEELIADPVGTLARVERFLGLEPGGPSAAAAQEQVGRKNPDAAQRELPEYTEEIAGDVLRRLGYLA